LITFATQKPIGPMILKNVCFCFFFFFFFSFIFFLKTILKFLKLLFSACKDSNKTIISFNLSKTLWLPFNNHCLLNSTLPYGCRFYKIKNGHFQDGINARNEEKRVSHEKHANWDRKAALLLKIPYWLWKKCSLLERVQNVFFLLLQCHIQWYLAGPYKEEMAPKFSELSDAIYLQLKNCFSVLRTLTQ